MNYFINVKTARQLINNLLMSVGDIDEEVYIKICRRDENGVVTHVSVNPISYIDAHNNLCIEESQVKFVKYI